MFTVFLILAIIAAIVLFPAILLQAGQGGGLTAQFGGGSTDSFVGGRQAATWLHKASWYAGGGFLGICFILQLMGSSGTAPTSLTEQQLRQQQQEAAPRPLTQPPLQNALPVSPSEAPANPPATTTPPAGSQKRP